ncbi:MAG: glycerol-3-phosphate 1-O-acyltransferase PlsY [bacterium]|nr:glycerol-3-phosphate 1-O-acyltransferase PlsY [bacterium]
MNDFLKVFLYVLSTYLVAGIPFAFIISKLFLKIDIRKVGSGNVGATNVYRAGGWKWAVPVFALDFLKGFLPVLVSISFFDKNLHVSTIVAVAAILGHMFTPYLNFQGGKGAATSFGAFVVIFPVVAAICVIAFVITVSLSRIVALGTIIGVSLFPIIYFVLGRVFDFNYPFNYFSYANLILILGIVAFIIFKHRSNIIRMKKGNENKI